MQKWLTVVLILVLLAASVATSGGAQAKPPDTISKAPGVALNGEVGIITLENPVAVPETELTGQAVIADQPLQYEVEPNDIRGSANPLNGPVALIEGNIGAASDVDYYSFTAQAGERIYAATVTAASNASQDTIIELQDSTGDIIESDDDDGSFSQVSSSIAGALIPADGTYYLRVAGYTSNMIVPYRLYLRVQSGSPVAEIEPNNLPGTANSLPVSGWVNGVINPTGDADVYSLPLNAGDTVFLSLDLDPERNLITWDGRLGLGLFYGSNVLVVNDASTTSPNSEAFFITVKQAGIYYIYVDTAASGTAVNSYQLSVTVYPAQTPSGSCTTYSYSAVTPLTDSGVTTVTINVPGHPIIADLDVSLGITHTSPTEVDLVLQAPGGNLAGLLIDMGSTSYPIMNLTLDDEAAIPVDQYDVMNNLVSQPQYYFQLGWFDGQDAGGQWTLYIYDSAASNTGTLTNFNLTICEPPPLLNCPSGSRPVVVYTNDFESFNGGFVTWGTGNSWAWGTPTSPLINSCANGTKCWKTNLSGSYASASTSGLTSPQIDLTNPRLVGPLLLTWQQKYQMEKASYDQARLDVAGSGGLFKTAWTWRGPTMQTGVGVDGLVIAESAGWGEHAYDLTAFRGQGVNLMFILTSDRSFNYAGLAVDDIQVMGCLSNDIYVPRVSD